MLVDVLEEEMETLFRPCIVDYDSRPNSVLAFLVSFALVRS